MPEVDVVTRILQAVHQPVPVEGALDRHPDSSAERLQDPEDVLHPVRDLAVHEHASVIVDDAHLR